MTTKICCKCKEDKPTTEFNKCSNSKDGLNYSCRECTKKYKNEHRKNNIEKANEYCRNYYKKNKDKKWEYEKKKKKKSVFDILEQKEEF